MSRTYFYCRVSTCDQTTENQVQAFRARGYDVPSNRIVEDTVSGSVEALKRHGFRNMVEHKLEAGDTLVVLKLDRLGRDNIDVQQTIEMLLAREITVHCLDLPVANLASPEGKMMLQVFSAFAEFERNRIRERTREGLERAKAQGKALGRPKTSITPEEVRKLRNDGLSIAQAAEQLGVSPSTIKRLSKPQAVDA